jgi:hypothetical protein
MPTPYINAVELDIVPAEYEKFKARFWRTQQRAYRPCW